MMRRMILPLLSLGLLAGCVVADGPGYYAGPGYARPWHGGGYAYRPPPPPPPAWRGPSYAWRGPPPRQHWGGGPPPARWDRGPPPNRSWGPRPGGGGGGGFAGRGDHNNGRGAEGGH